MWKLYKAFWPSLRYRIFLSPHKAPFSKVLMCNYEKSVEFYALIFELGKGAHQPDCFPFLLTLDPAPLCYLLCPDRQTHMWVPTKWIIGPWVLGDFCKQAEFSNQQDEESFWGLSAPPWQSWDALGYNTLSTLDPWGPSFLRFLRSFVTQRYCHND